jgi:hypothetical protein
VDQDQLASVVMRWCRRGIIAWLGGGSVLEPKVHFTHVDVIGVSFELVDYSRGWMLDHRLGSDLGCAE